MNVSLRLRFEMRLQIRYVLAGDFTDAVIYFRRVTVQ